MADKARGEAVTLSSEFERLRALWELKHVQYDADIVRWEGITKYVIYRKRGAFDSAHAYTLIVPVAYGSSTAWSCVLDPSSLW